MSIMLMDMAVKDWLEKIHPGLIDKVKIEFGVQIKAGTRISALAPQIAKAIPSLLKKMNTTRNDVIKVLNDIGHDTQENTTYVNSLQFRRGGGSRRGQSRGARGAYGNRRPSNNYTPSCRHCKWLHDHWDVKEIDYNHETKSCRRTMPPEVRLINEIPPEDSWQAEEDDEAEEDDFEDNQGEPPYTTVIKNNEILFQKHKSRADKTVEQEEKETNLKQSPQLAPAKYPQQISVSEEISSIRDRSVRLINIASSPKIKITYNHHHAILLVDEGSGLNAVDGEFVKRNDIEIIQSDRNATAAGSHKLNIVGETLNDLVVDTRFGSRHFSINLGKAVVIPNLGSELILGEPGKALNGITTDPEKKLIVMKRQGEKMVKEYEDSDPTTSSVCRIVSDSTTIFPNDSLEVKIPEEFQFSMLAPTVVKAGQLPAASLSLSLRFIASLSV